MVVSSPSIVGDEAVGRVLAPRRGNLDVHAAHRVGFGRHELVKLAATRMSVILQLKGPPPAASSSLRCL